MLPSPHAVGATPGREEQLGRVECRHATGYRSYRDAAWVNGREANGRSAWPILSQTIGHVNCFIITFSGGHRTRRPLHALEPLVESGVRITLRLRPHSDLP